MRNRTTAIAVAICSLLAVTEASAASDIVNIVASSGTLVSDADNCLPTYADGILTSIGTCDAYYPIVLPVGKFIDGAEVGYSYENNILPPGVAYISASIEGNQYRPDFDLPLLTLPAIAYLPTGTQYGLSLPVHTANGPIPIAKYTTYWVHVTLYGPATNEGIQIVYH